MKIEFCAKEELPKILKDALEDLPLLESMGVQGFESINLNCNCGAYIRIKVTKDLGGILSSDIKLVGKCKKESFPT